MAGGKLEVKIGADVSEFEKKIKEVEFDIKELSKVKLDRLKVGLDTTEINSQIKDAKNNLNTLKTTVKDTGQSFSKGLSPQVANGSNALMQFSRIAQDAPYGIIGIGNNITATAESFGYLKQQTGSTSGALKAMASSLMGTGGILLGVSLLTTGFTLLAQSGLSVGDIIDKITGNFDDLSASIKKATEEGQKQAGQEIQNLKELVAVAQNDAIAKKDRLIAVEKLQTQFPAYYGNLSAEKILYGDLTRETNLATQALLARGIAEKLSAKAGDKFIERLNAQQKFNEAKQKIDEFDKKSEIFLASLKGEHAAQIAKAKGREFAMRNKLLESAEKERQEVVKLVKEYDSLGNVINKLNQISAPLDRKAPKSASSPSTNVSAPRIPDEKIGGTPIGGLQPIKLKIEDPANEFELFNQKVVTGLSETQILLYEFNVELDKLVNDSIAGTFANLGTAIGDALANGGNVLSAIGSTLLQSLGSFLSALGDKLITYGLLLAGFGKAELAFKYGTPEVKIGAGIAMVALGIAAKAAGSIVSSAGSGGLSKNTSSSTGSGANNQSFSSGGFTSNSSSSGGTVVFEIAGQKLIGVLSNTLNANKRLGGQTFSIS
jgi:hypothetical protein